MKLFDFDGTVAQASRHLDELASVPLKWGSSGTSRKAVLKWRCWMPAVAQLAQCLLSHLRSMSQVQPSVDG